MSEFELWLFCLFRRSRISGHGRRKMDVWVKSHLSEDLHTSMSLVEVTSLQARLCGSGLEESGMCAGGEAGTRASMWGCWQAAVTSMLSSESKFNVSSAGATWGSSTTCFGDLWSAFSCLMVANSCPEASSPSFRFMSASLSSDGWVEVLTWELPLGLLRGRSHLGLMASPSISVSLLSGCSVPRAFFSTFLFFSFLIRFPFLSSDGEAGTLRTEGTEGGSKDCMAEQSTTVPTSEPRLQADRMEALESAEGVRAFLVACMAFSVVSTSPDRLSLQSAGLQKFSQLCSVLVWYSSGFLSGDGWKFEAGAARVSDAHGSVHCKFYWHEHWPEIETLMEHFLLHLSECKNLLTSISTEID